jgi:hypothetical protein
MLLEYTHKKHCLTAFSVENQFPLATNTFKEKTFFPFKNLHFGECWSKTAYPSGKGELYTSF